MRVKGGQGTKTEGTGHTSEREVEGKTLLAEARVEMLNYAEVGVVSVLVVHRSYMKLPARNHDEIQVWKCNNREFDGKVSNQVILFMAILQSIF